MPIEYKERITVKDCRANLSKYFIFGDNVLNTGKKGQSVIRDHPNAIGIVTKKLPSMEEEAFFSDKDIYKYQQIIYPTWVKIHILLRHEFVIVFPTAPLGSGLAQLNTRAPLIFEFTNSLVKLAEQEFNKTSVT